MQVDLHRFFNCSLQVLLILLHCLWPRAPQWIQGRHTQNHLLNFMETLRVHGQMGGLVLNIHFGYVLSVATSLAAMAAKGKLHGPLQENLFPHLVSWSLGFRSMWSSRIQGPAPSRVLPCPEDLPNFSNFDPQSSIKCDASVKASLCPKHKDLLASEFGLFV